MTFVKLPPINPIQHCNVCPPRPQTAPLDMLPHPGFGAASLSSEEGYYAGLGYGATVRDCEEVAARRPDHDWRLAIDGSLYSAVYQRQGEGKWVLVERGEGFA